MRRKLVIIEAVFSRSWGGLEMLAGQYAAWFQERGHTVYLCSPRNKNLLNYISGRDVPWIDVNPLTRYCDIFSAWKISRLMKSKKVDILHAHISRDLSTLCIAKKMAGRGALVFSQHMDSRYPKKDLFHRWVYRGIDRIITITDQMREHQLEFSPARPEQVMRIYNGIDTERFKPGTAGAEPLKIKHGIPAGKKVISLIGRLDRLKNQMLLIQAAPEIIRANNDVYFLIVGDETPGRDGSGYKDELTHKISTLKLNKYFSIRPFHDNIEEVMAISDAVVLTTPKESFGLVLIEAMAMEKPVIGANAGGAAEIIADYKTGRLFEARSRESLAAAINDVLGNPEKARMMGKTGRQEVLEKFNKESNFLKYEAEFYNRAVL